MSWRIILISLLQLAVTYIPKKKIIKFKKKIIENQHTTKYIELGYPRTSSGNHFAHMFQQKTLSGSARIQ
jgi:hypothetical protein